GEASWATLVSYVRATVLVAFIDAVGIGLSLVVLRVQFAFPLAALVFLGAFVPIVGATVSGAVAVLVALVTRDPITALAVLIAVIAVQQLEGHVLQPLIMGRAVAIHPLAVIVAIATGLVLAGIIGALVAVPTVAVLNTGVRHLIEHRHEPIPDAGEGLVRTREREPVDDHELTGLPGHVDALPQRHDAEQATVALLPEPAHQQRQRLLALQQHGQPRLRADHLGRPFGRPAGGEQPE